MKRSDATVFIIDDDASVRKSLMRLMSSIGLKTEAFSSPRVFLGHPPYQGPGCLILDVRMPGMSGLQLKKHLTRTEAALPIIFISGHGTIQMSVDAMKRGAMTFLEKPFEDQDLIDAVHEAISKSKMSIRREKRLNGIRKKVSLLTTREHEVFVQVVSGKLNKQIAFELGTTEKTIKIHRARVMEKMQAESLAELVRMAEKVGIKALKA